MSKWISARSIALKKSEFIEIDDDEKVMTADYHPPLIYLVIVKESPRNPNLV